MSETDHSQIAAVKDIVQDTTQIDINTILSCQDLRIFQIVNHVCLSGAVCLFGMLSNIINMVIFVKQGFHDTVNLNLFALSVSDWCSLVTLQWVNINLNPFMDNADVPFEPIDVQYQTGGWPHACFARITIWITIFVTAERLACVAIPLRVKQVITPLRAKVVICIIYVVMVLTLLPEYLAGYLGERFVHTRNQTRVGIIGRVNRHLLEETIFWMYAGINFVSYPTQIVLTVVLIVCLRRRSAWRRGMSRGVQQAETLAKRDRKTIKMVSLVAIVLIICFSPAFALYIALLFTPGFNLTGTFSNVFNSMWSVAFLVEAINSSVNIFIFYRMSSKYRQTFYSLLSRCSTCCHCPQGNSRERSQEPVQNHTPTEATECH